MLKKLTARGGPLGIFVEYPALLSLGLICLCAETAWATLLFVMEFYFKEDVLKGQSPQFITSKVAWALLAFVGFETVFKYPMGALADKYGPRRFVFLALGICSVTPILLYLFARQWWHFIPLRAFDGIAAAALWPAMSALMARAVPRQAKAAAMSVFNAAYCLGLAVGPMAGLLIGHLSGSNIYVFPLCALVMMVGLFIAWRTLDATPARPKTTEENLAPEASGQLLRNRTLFRMMVLYGLSQVGVGILAPTVPVYIEGQFGIFQKDLPRLIAVPAVFIVLIALPLGRLPDTLGRAKSVWISYVMAAVGMILIACSSLFAPTTNLFSPSVLIFATGVLTMAASYILGTPAWLGLTSLQVDDRKQAQAMSLMQTAQGVGVVVALFSVAAAGHFMTTWQKIGNAVRHRSDVAVISKDSLPLSVWFWIATIVFVLCLVGTLLWVREPPHDEHAEEMAKSAEQPLEITGV
ncbi:MAG TPA: MFS transporter [Abditibacteriaceae bacterium]|jgi:MFS family permease